MKICTACGVEKPLSEYHKKVKSRDGYKHQCKECCAKWHKEYLVKPGRRAGIRRAVSKRRDKIVAIVANIKDVPCLDCGNKYPPQAMDFDHKPGALKLNNVSRITQLGWSQERILEEISKCEIVCANCHRIRTHNRRSSNRRTRA